MIFILRDKAIVENLISKLNQIVFGDGRFIYQVEIKEYIKKHPGRSCILERVVYNSKDGHKVGGAE